MGQFTVSSAVVVKEHFAPLQDPRIDRNERHELMDIIVLVICAVTAGAPGWEAIEEFGQDRSGEAGLAAHMRTFAPFANGIPSHDCIANVISRLSPKGFQACFCSWTEAVSEATEEKINLEVIENGENRKPRLSIFELKNPGMAFFSVSLSGSVFILVVVRRGRHTPSVEEVSGVIHG